MLSGQNNTIVHRFFDEGLSAGNMAFIQQMLDAGFTLHSAPSGLPPEK